MTGSISRRLLKQHSKSPEMRTDLAPEAVAEISDELLLLLSDVFSLFLKTKNFHWHVTGPHFREYHLMLDEQADQIFAMTDIIAERARKMGASTVRSISDISRHQRLKDNNEEGLAPLRMLEELYADNQQLTMFLRRLHEICERYNDVATASLVEVWVDETQRRAWFLSETLVDLRLPVDEIHKNEKRP
jgi:starvation-inducible DNA-binding protein